MAEIIPIASLQPHETIPADHAIDAEISLLWPYSTSHASCALLLVDPDFRRRHARGEIRVRFQGPVAKQLALAKVGIGDRIKLDLKGARWRKSDKKALQLTPGRPVEAELLFDRHVRFAVLDSSALKELQVVEYDEPSAPVSDAGDEPRIPSTPGAGLVRTGATNSPIVGGYASPAYMKRLRLSQGQYLDSPGLTRVSNDLEDSAGKRRKLSGEATVKWTVVRTEPSTGMNAASQEDNSVFPPATVDDSDPFVAPTPVQPKEVQNEVPNASQTAANQRHDFMKPPSRSRPGKPVLMPAIDLKDRGPLTPVLFPVSPGSLPQPSPFPQTPISAAGIFQSSSTPFAMPTLNEADVAALPPKSLGYFDLESAKVMSEPHAIMEKVQQEPEPEQASGTQPVVIEIDDDDDAAEDEDEASSQDADPSIRSTPSDDEDGDIITQKQRFFAGDSGPPTSQLPSYIGSPVLPSQVEPLLPSALPVLNDHHPFGLGKPSLSRKTSRDDSHKSPDLPEQAHTEAVLSEDEDAAWQAMDEAMHGMAPDAHEKHQAPALPLTSVLEPVHHDHAHAAARRPSTVATIRPPEPAVEKPPVSQDPKPIVTVPNVLSEATGPADPSPLAQESDEIQDSASGLSNGQHPKLVAIDETSAPTAEPLVSAPAAVTMQAPSEKPRRRPATRLSIVSNGLNEYFGPQKAPIEPTARDRRRTIHDLPSEPQPSPTTSSQGTTTSLTYLTPLSALSPHLNTPTPLDVLAVVVSATDPLRAKSGPRDWHTSLALASPSSSDGTTRAEIFRPWKASLPTAQAGDVVLLRNFLVRSRERRVGLLSSEASAWCVFRAPDEEEMRGPPVEVGEEERTLARDLREWWTRQEKKAKGKGRATL